jgi:Flp pilus assembly protein TadG
VLTRQRSGASQRGAAAVEFALVVPVLIVLIFGITDLGLMFNNQSVVANASRDAARAASFGAKQAAIQAVVNAEVASLPNVVFPVTTSVTCTKVNGTNCVVYDTDAVSGGTVTVTITYVHKWLTPSLIGVPNTQTITKVSQMRIE